MFRKFRSSFGRHALLAGMDDPNSFQEFLPQLALHQIGSRSGLESTRNLNVAGMSRQHDDSCFRKFTANRSDRIDTVHLWHLQVHKCYVRLMFSKQVERFVPVGSFTNQFHIFLAPDQGSDAITQEGMIVRYQYSNHSSHLFLPEEPEPGSPRRCAVSNRAGEAQIDFRAGTRAAPNSQFRANLPGTFAHSRQAEVSGAALVQNFGWNAFTIISDSQAE